MSTPTSLKAFYEERADLAYSIEHPLNCVTPASLSRRFANLEDKIADLEAAFKQTWRLPQTGGVALLPWCSVCGRNDRALLSGRMLCSVCAAAQTEGDSSIA